MHGRARVNLHVRIHAHVHPHLYAHVSIIPMFQGGGARVGGAVGEGGLRGEEGWGKGGGRSRQRWDGAGVSGWGSSRACRLGGVRAGAAEASRGEPATRPKQGRRRAAARPGRGEGVGGVEVPGMGPRGGVGSAADQRKSGGSKWAGDLLSDAENANISSGLLTFYDVKQCDANAKHVHNNQAGLWRDH